MFFQAIKAIRRHKFGMEELLDYLIVSREELNLGTLLSIEDAVYCGYGVVKVPYDIAKENEDEDIVKLLDFSNDECVYMVPIRIYGLYGYEIDNMLTPGNHPLSTLRLP